MSVHRTILPGETELQRWSLLTLTTHRVVFSSDGSSATSTSILLRSLEWTRLGRSHQPLLLVIAVLLLVGSLAILAGGGREPAIATGPLLGGLLLLALYFGGRKTTLILAAGEGRIEVVLGGDAKSGDAARAFVNAVEHAALRAQTQGL
ncbi:MAG TPA: hypothetical protein PKW35_13300 [Nannocystaceae bacterium]|nr:hypothetical protein [Nannocystaceae bacterium]